MKCQFISCSVIIVCSLGFLSAFSSKAKTFFLQPVAGSILDELRQNAMAHSHGYFKCLMINISQVVYFSAGKIASTLFLLAQCTHLTQNFEIKTKGIPQTCT